MGKDDIEMHLHTQHNATTCPLSTQPLKSLMVTVNLTGSRVLFNLHMANKFKSAGQCVEIKIQSEFNSICYKAISNYISQSLLEAL